jgi:hypothetical protein
VANCEFGDSLFQSLYQKMVHKGMSPNLQNAKGTCYGFLNCVLYIVSQPEGFSLSLSLERGQSSSRTIYIMIACSCGRYSRRVVSPPGKFQRKSTVGELSAGEPCRFSRQRRVGELVFPIVEFFSFFFSLSLSLPLPLLSLSLSLSLF